MNIFVPCAGFDFSVDHRVGSKASYDDLVAWVESLGFDLDHLGKSQDDLYDIYGFGLGNPSKPCIYIVANQHGWERGGSHFGVEFLRRIRDNAFLAPELNTLDQHFYFYMIVSANPYGYQEGDYYNPRGVNINRNYDFNFESTGSGESPFSEPETQIIRDLAYDLKPFALIDNHMWGGSEITGIGVGNNNLHPVWTDKVLKRLELVTENPFGRWAQNSASTLRNWGATLDSKNGGKTVSILLEVKNITEGGNYSRSYDGINAYAFLCLYLKDYFINRIIV